MNVNALRNLAIDHRIDASKKKKEDLIQEILICQTSASVSMLIEQQDSEKGSFQDSLPQFTAVVYDHPDLVSLSCITFSDMYNFIIERPTPYGGRSKYLRDFTNLFNMLRLVTCKISKLHR